MRLETLLILACLVWMPSAPAFAQDPAPEATELRLRVDLDELRHERDQIPQAGPAALTLTCALLIPGGLVGGLVVALTGRDTLGAAQFPLMYTLFGVSIAALIPTVIGAIWWGESDQTRRAYRRRIRELEAMPSVAIGPGGASITLSGRF